MWCCAPLARGGFFCARTQRMGGAIPPSGGEPEAPSNGGREPPSKVGHPKVPPEHPSTGGALATLKGGKLLHNYYNTSVGGYSKYRAKENLYFGGF